MDKYRILLSILFVTLSWGCMKTTSATVSGRNSTAALEGNSTAAGGNSTAAGGNSTAAGGNSTAAGGNSTAAGGNSTAAGGNSTAAGGNSTAAGGNSTAAGGNSTAPGGNSTAPGGNSTAPGGNSTAPGGNSTAPGGNSTAPVTSPMTTTPPPVSPNNTVQALPTDVNRSECGTTQLCAAEPSTCDPSTDSSCFFLGAKLKDGNNFEFALSGQSDGYIAASVLSPVNGKKVTYVCANNNSAVKFFGAILENGQLNLTVISVTSVKGKVKGNTIQCSFLATVPDPRVQASKRARRATDVTLSVSTGSYNSSADSLGAPSVKIQADVADLKQTNATVKNEINSTTSTPTAAPTFLGISSSSCGSTKLCASEPSSCNPANGGTCSFLSAKQVSGQIYSFELSGLSDGYIASALSNDSTVGNGDSAYVCANNNGVVKFITATLNNNVLTQTPLNVTSGSVSGKINGKQIQCVFQAVLPDTTARAAVFSIVIMNGTYNPSTDFLGTANILLRTSVVDLSNPSSNTTNLVTSGVAPHHHPFMQALLIPVGILVLTILGQ